MHFKIILAFEAFEYFHYSDHMIPSINHTIPTTDLMIPTTDPMIPTTNFMIPLISWSHSVYSPASCDDDMKDLLFQRRIRMLNWVEPKHLDIPLKLELPQVQELISQGRQGKIIAPRHCVYTH